MDSVKKLKMKTHSLGPADMYSVNAAVTQPSLRGRNITIQQGDKCLLKIKDKEEPAGVFKILSGGIVLLVIPGVTQLNKMGFLDRILFGFQIVTDSFFKGGIIRSGLQIADLALGDTAMIGSDEESSEADREWLNKVKSEYELAIADSRLNLSQLRCPNFVIRDDEIEDDAFAYWNPKKYEIGFSRDAAELPWNLAIPFIRHEIAHLLADYLVAEAISHKDGHGLLYNMVADRLSVPQDLRG